MGVPLVCKKCKLPYLEEPDDEGEGTGLCYYCFEGALEQYEIDKRRRIAEQNEY